MSIVGILASSALSLLAPSAPNPAKTPKQDFQQLGQDLKSGNLSAAQSDFTALQQNVTPSASAVTLPQAAVNSTSAISQDFAKLSTDLQSGNLTGAQADYNLILQAFQTQAAQSQAPTGHHHHHHAASSEASDTSASTSTSPTSATASSTTSNPAAQLFTELGQALQSSNLSAARQAYSSLQQDFQQFAPANTSSGSTPAVNGSTGISFNA
jgi:outer membrane protein assembly factor BamD (BamD/ComL family)